MHFVLIGRDGSDEGALDRRMGAREAHLEHMKVSRSEGTILFAVALKLDGKMVGSVIVFECESRDYIDEWLESEPYVLQNVWESIEINEGAIPVLD